MMCHAKLPKRSGDKRGIIRSLASNANIAVNPNSANLNTTARESGESH